MFAALTAWLWPIGLGGKMPVGGDVTGFSIGLMGVLRRSLLEGRLPLWNDLWGYGFPGLAESQMGVYYPPHWLLYRALPTEAAYTASLVFHTYFAGLGAYWAGRRLGSSAAGSAVGAWAFAAGGIFVVHLPHQWGYTVGSWMPWAWGLAWTIARGAGTARTALALSAVLAIQVLPGHFQLAFQTQVGVLGLAAWALIARPKGWKPALRAASGLGLGCMAVVPLAASQIWPTARLAALAAERRNPEYLSGFAATPIHLISYVAPGLFHRSPLWRPIAWDPFHTSPEEQLAFVGVVPLFLAVLALCRSWKRDPAVRALAMIAFGSLWLSLGPYLPGFHVLGSIPGFSFFRAPARWGLATSLALALIAARGFDLARDAPRVGRSLLRFGSLTAIAPTFLVIGFEGALFATEGRGVPEIASAFDRLTRLSPWKDDPSFVSVMAAARQPQNDLRVRTGLAREGYKGVPRSGLSLQGERGPIYLRELTPTAVTIVALLALATIAGRRGPFSAGLVILSGLELLYWARLRTIEVAPIRPLQAQSPTLKRLSELPRGTRSADPLNNLPMIAGVAPIGAYRTLDLPVVPGLTALARAPGNGPGAGRIAEALNAAGAAVKVLGIGDRPGGAGEVQEFGDPDLAAWFYGPDWVAGEGSAAARFGIWTPGNGGRRAWFLAIGRASKPLEPIPANRDDAPIVLDLLGSAFPADSFRSQRPEQAEIRVKVDRPGLLIVSMLHDPEWSARVSGPIPTRPAEIRRAFGMPGGGAWMGIEIPSRGDWTVVLDYRGDAAKLGIGISGVAWLTWILAYWSLGGTRHDSGGDRGGDRLLGPGIDPDPPAPPGGKADNGDLPAGGIAPARRDPPEPLATP